MDTDVLSHNATQKEPDGDGGVQSEPRCRGKLSEFLTFP